MMDFICVTLDGRKRWINIYEIAAMEEEGEGTVVYLKGNGAVHIACDQGISEVVDLVMSGVVDNEELDKADE